MEFDAMPLRHITVLSLERLAFLELEGKVDYRYGQDACRAACSPKGGW